MSLHHSFHLRLFVLLASILVIWVLAVIGSATDFFRREYHNNSDVQETFESSYSNTSLNNDVSQYWNVTSGTQKHLIATLHKYLKESFALLQSKNVEKSDVWVLPLKDDVLKKMYGGPSPAADSSNSAGEINIDHVDVIASVVPAVQFVYNAKFTCASLNQTRRAYESSKIRVFDAYYNVCSTCFRAIIGYSGAAANTTIHVQKGPVANAIYLLRPFALRINSSFSCRVKNIIADPTVNDMNDNMDIAIDEISNLGPTPLPGGSSASIVVYYLDYVEPIMDVIKKTPAKSKSQFTSKVDVTKQTLIVSASSVPSSTYTIDFSITSTSTTTSKTNESFDYPGIINAAKLAKQFSSSRYNNASSTQIRPITQWNNSTNFRDVDLATMFGHQTPSSASGCVLAETETSSVWPRAPGSPKCFQSDVTLNHAM